MPLVPVDWNVVILGAWNRAILTPSGISKRLFGLPLGTLIEVYVPLDVPAPIKVSYKETSVIAARDRLIIIPERSNHDSLSKAMAIARTALTELPETPVTAAGFNFKFKSEKPVSALSEVVDHELDRALADQHLKVVSRLISRAVTWRDGEIRLSVSQETDQSYSILLNFHKESDDDEVLKKWLSVPIAGARKVVESILYSCLGLHEGSINYDEKDD